MLVSSDLDCTNTMYIQFSFKFITKGESDVKRFVSPAFLLMGMTALVVNTLFSVQAYLSALTPCCCSIQ